MKKDIEWLKNEVLNQNLINKDGYIYAGNLTRLLNQLGEPEVLSQEKVQIPWFVYKWIEHQKMFNFNIYDLLSLASKGKWATESMNKFINENGELFIKAWLAYPNIEVEKEQKYYVVNKNGSLILERNTDTEYDDTIAYAVSGRLMESVVACDEEHLYQFTEQEIKDYDERYFAFAVKVEELEE